MSKELKIPEQGNSHLQGNISWDRNSLFFSEANQYVAFQDEISLRTLLISSLTIRVHNLTELSKFYSLREVHS
jgi:hypothetical protein